MKHFIIILAVFSIICPSFSAINNAEISALRQRATSSGSQVSDADQPIIEKFLRAGLSRMFLTQEADEVVDIRRQIKEEKGPENLSLYADAYINEASNELKLAFENVDNVENQSKRELISRNLMILVAEFQNAKLVPLALERIADQDEVVRYWAVKALTQPAVLEQLTRGVTPDPQMTESVLKALLERSLAENRPEIRRMMINFAGSVDSPTARQLLTTIAEGRLKAYKDWTVQDEKMDISLLNAIGGVAIMGQGGVKSEFGRKFAELYSVVFQRYMKGQGKLDSESMERLITIIAEIDQNCVAKTFEIKTGILTAVRRKTGLEREYETLFGNRMMAGELAAKFRFDYGKDAAGNAITAPPEIGPLPETVASK